MTQHEKTVTDRRASSNTHTEQGALEDISRFIATGWSKIAPD